MSFIQNLDWRYAVKKYDPERDVSKEDLEKVLHSIRMTPSSGGTQPYHVVVAGGELKDRLFDSNKQLDKKGATYLLVFCARNDFPKRIDEYVSLVSRERQKSLEDLSGLKNMLLSGVSGMKEEEIMSWAKRQTYIALGFALAAAAEIGLDSTPMEGFDPKDYHAILGLPDHIEPVVIMALGYRSSEDPYSPEKAKKVRFPDEDLFDYR